MAVPFSYSLGFTLFPLVLGSKTVASSQAVHQGPEAWSCNAIVKTVVASEGLFGIPDLPLT